MDRIRLVGIAAGLAAMLSAPALAQPGPAPAGTPATANPPAAGSEATVPFGSVQRNQDEWRGRTLIGATVLDDNGRRLGTINDLLITDDHRIDKAILSVGRVRRNLVAVPFDSLRFVPARSTGMPVHTRGVPVSHPALGEISSYGVVLPGATRDSLAQMPAFRFTP